MPVVPNNGKFLIDLTSVSGVDELVGLARSLDPAKVARFGTSDNRTAADVGDHLLFLGATHPEWFAPYRDEAVTDLADRMPMDLSTAAVLLPGLARTSIDRLCERLSNDPSNWQTLTLLAGSDDELGLEVLADAVRQHDVGQWTNRLGIHVGDNGPAVRRFSTSRYAFFDSSETTNEPAGIIGLPLAEVVDPEDDHITWHYLSIRSSEVEGIPPWPHEMVHIVAPRTYWYTLHCNVVGPDGRYRTTAIDDEGQPFDAHLREIEAEPPPVRYASLRRYDADLVYRNGHVHLTPGLIGEAGGPPIGLYPNPVCPTCGVLMFHVATVESGIREYGDGFRSAFICETCVRAAVTGTNWN